MDLVGPHPEAVERVQAERRADGHIGCVAPARDEHAADARSVVARIEDVPLATQKGLEPARKVHRTRLGRDADVAQVAGAIAGRNVHASAERDRQVRKVAADALSLSVDLPGGLHRAREFVAERDVSIDEVANGLHAPPAGRGLGEQFPSDFGQPVGFAISASQQEQQCFFAAVLAPECCSAHGDTRVGKAAVVHDGIGHDARSPLRRHDPVAPVAEAVSITRIWDRRIGDHVIGPNQIGRSRIVNVQRQDHRRRFGTACTSIRSRLGFAYSPRNLGSTERTRDSLVHRKRSPRKHLGRTKQQAGETFRPLDLSGLVGNEILANLDLDMGQVASLAVLDDREVVPIACRSRVRCRRRSVPARSGAGRAPIGRAASHDRTRRPRARGARHP